jgi:hypothetical protein
MRTKALLGLAAIAASALTAAAQSNVYSLNVVGYYNVPVAAGTANKLMIANQLNTTNNTIASLIPNGPPGAQFFKFNGGFSGSTFDDIDLAWEPDATLTLNPGEGGFYITPTATTLTFVGEVMQGHLVNTLPINTKVIRSSMVPQAGKISTDLGVPGEGGDQMFQFHGGYGGAVFDDVDLVWTPSEPTIAVGEAFFYIKSPLATQSQWVRNFTVQ